MLNMKFYLAVSMFDLLLKDIVKCDALDRISVEIFVFIIEQKASSCEKPEAMRRAA